MYGILHTGIRIGRTRKCRSREEAVTRSRESSTGNGKVAVGSIAGAERSADRAGRNPGVVFRAPDFAARPAKKAIGNQNSVTRTSENAVHCPPRVIDTTKIRTSRMTVPSCTHEKAPCSRRFLTRRLQAATRMADDMTDTAERVNRTV